MGERIVLHFNMPSNQQQKAGGYIFNPEVFKPSWVSAAILKYPETSGIFCKGALILNQVDHVVARFPKLPRLFHIIERRGWFGMNTSRLADIKLVEDTSTIERTRRLFPKAVLLDLGPADFVDCEAFAPGHLAPRYDIIQIACWSPRKRIELLIEAAGKIPSLSVVHLGHFENGGTQSELQYRASCIQRARELGANISFQYAGCKRNEEMPLDKHVVNKWLNSARIGILTTCSEGINRFKMECLAADRPVLVAADAGGPTSKHINDLTGLHYDPQPDALAAAIRSALQNKNYAPRKYLLSHSGKERSIKALMSALAEICERNGQRFVFQDIDWDGRNESLFWGDHALKQLKDACDDFDVV